MVLRSQSLSLVLLMQSITVSAAWEAMNDETGVSYAGELQLDDECLGASRTCALGALQLAAKRHQGNVSKVEAAMAQVAAGAA
ncbi:unnamed protein product, partial [Polarella glacialis]